MREEVGKETPKKEIDLYVFLWRHTWHFSYIKIQINWYPTLSQITIQGKIQTPTLITLRFKNQFDKLEEYEP